VAEQPRIVRMPLAPELGHEWKDETAGMWGDQGRTRLAVVYIAPLGNGGLPKRHQQWYDPEAPRGGRWLDPSRCGSPVS